MIIYQTPFIPVLKGKTAKQFLKVIKKNSKNKSTIDFTEERNIAKMILKKSKLYDI